MNINFKISSAGKPKADADVVMDLSSLPVTRVEKGAGGIFMIIFSLFCGGLPTVALIISIVTGQFTPAILYHGEV
jgi:hypothetical protein